MFNRMMKRLFCQTRVMCRLFGHDYKLLRKISPTIREVKCGRCKQEFGMNDSVKGLLPLDDELRDYHPTLLCH
jgi:hypothetical protein